ncbi:MAG TPA: MerR family DNA-binding transcriptional regulator [Streptosporangiaceae bacterium]|jgi:hypothetical protein
MDEVSIGEFARRSRLSVKALRLYDELGVLAPARVDEGSGYRYCPELTLRTEPAHREAFVPLSAGPAGTAVSEWQLASEALRTWADEHGIAAGSVALTPEDPGIRITYLASQPVTETSTPYCDFAVPYA